eukprot:SAG31_NODE_4324_length_3357_cov_2.015347_2_plen_202_part_00
MRFNIRCTHRGSTSSLCILGVQTALATSATAHRLQLLNSTVELEPPTAETTSSGRLAVAHRVARLDRTTGSNRDGSTGISIGTLIIIFSDTINTKLCSAGSRSAASGRTAVEAHAAGLARRRPHAKGATADRRSSSSSGSVVSQAPSFQENDAKKNSQFAGSLDEQGPGQQPQSKAAVERRATVFSLHQRSPLSLGSLLAN